MLICHWQISLNQVCLIRQRLPTRKVIDEDFLLIRAYVKGGVIPKNTRKCDHRVTKGQSKEINKIIRKGVFLKKTNREIRSELNKEKLLLITDNAVARRIKKYRTGVYV